MGMTDSQFKAFLRVMLDDIEEALDEEEPEKKEKKLNKIRDYIMRSLED